MELFGVTLTPEVEIVVKLGISIALGGLAGLEREYARKDGMVREFAGIRTFILTAIMGTISAMLGFWFFVISFAAFAVLVALAYYALSQKGAIGGTTEVATLIIFIVGGLVYFEHFIAAATVAVVTTAFLSVKPVLHKFARGLSREDVYATLKLAIVMIVILPILPNETYGPLDVLNPFYVWLMVVFISCIGFAGYVAVKIFGGKGVGLTGLLGGLVSSTAVALAFSHRSKENVSLTRSFAIGITVASIIMFPRILLEVFVLNQPLFWMLLAPMLAMTAVGALASVLLLFREEKAETKEVELKNPFSVKQALKFGLFFAVILLAAKAAQVYFGDAGIYAASALSGLTDVDAITLSMASLAGTDDLSNLTASIAIIVAAISNTLVKGAMVAVFGSRQLSKYVLLILAGVVIMGIIASVVLFAI
jgi:uncharacterized membrane protein (DUF4010 family)